MADNLLFSRRGLLKSSLGLAGMAWLKPLSLFGEDLDRACVPTPYQGEGPYYPESDLNRDNDLTRFEPNGQLAQGEVIEISGVVTDEACRPIKGALVEVWQACASGKYQHSQDPNDLVLDPNFQYWGRTRSDEKGQYIFKTVVPGHYPVAPGRYRPPHVHFKAHASGFLSLTTQLYFNPKSFTGEKAAIVEELNDLESVPPALTVLFQLAGQIKKGRFDLSLRKGLRTA